MSKTAVAKFLAASVVTLALTLPGTGVAADDELKSGEPTGQDMMADLLIHRPLGLVQTVVRAGVWIVSLPFTIFGGDVGEAGNTLVVEPAAYTFARPLGRSKPVER